MCDCDNVEIGSYDNQIELSSPKWSSKPTICVDRCLANEIIDLWRHGIQTTGCCCGHNKLWGYIGVIPEHEARMIKLGYKVQFNSMRPDDTDSFWPKTVEFEPNNLLRFADRREKSLRDEIKKLMRGAA